MVTKRKLPGSNLARKNLMGLIQWKHLTQKPDPKTIYGIQHSWDRETRGETGSKDHIWDCNTVGRKTRPRDHNGQRPYMGFNTVGQENQTQKTIGFNTVGRKTRPKDHIWAKTIYGIQHSGTGKSDPKDDRIQHSWQENQTQRPYMGFNTVGQENQTQKTIGFNTVGRKTRPRDHIWAKTIYGIQHSGTGKSDPKDDRIQHSWQENQTQRPYMGKDHIWDSTQWDRKIRPKRR